MINLLPSDRKQQKQEFFKKAVSLFFWLLLLAVLMYFGLNYYKLSTENQIVGKKLRLAKNKLQEVNNRVRAINKIKRKREKLRKKLERRKRIIGDQIDWASNLKELKNLIPDDSWLKQYRIKKHDKFYIRGYTLTREELEELVKRFKDSPYFDDISLALVNKKKLVKSGYRPVKVVHYKLTGVLNSRSDTNAE